jgi:hypothetical protein
VLRLSFETGLFLISLVLLLLTPTVSLAADSTLEDADLEMSLTIVRSSRQSCEPNCPQWIAANGVITPQTPSLFREILENTEAQKLPIMIQSAGGELFSALEIGRMIRNAKRDVGIARTEYSACETKGRPCKAALAGSKTYYGLAKDDWSYCYSACTFLLAAGLNRVAAGSVAVGFHEPYRCKSGKRKTKFDPNDCVVTKLDLDSVLRTALTQYLDEMGVSGEIVAEMQKAPPDDMNVPGLVRVDELGLITTRFTALHLTGVSNCVAPKNAKNCVRAVE